MVTEYLEKDNLIICPNYLKKKIIKEINNSDRLVSYKIMDINEFKSKAFFSYSKKTCLYLMEKLGIQYSIALEYIESFYYLEDKLYQNPFLNRLVLLKKELFSNDLVTFNPLFTEYLKKVKILLYGDDLVDQALLSYLSKFSFTVIEEEENKTKREVLEFLDIEDEIAYVASDISRKLREGVDISQIKIVKPSDEYLLPLKRIFEWYHLPIVSKHKISLYDLPVGKLILDKVSKNISFSEILKEKEVKNSKFSDLIIRIFNEYVEIDVEVVKLLGMIEYDLKNTYLADEVVEGIIDFINLEEVKSDEAVYLLGFNKENYPKVYKDEEFLSDSMKMELGLLTSNDKNSRAKKSLTKNLYRPCFLTITYKLKTAFEEFNPSLLVSELDFSVIKDKISSFNYSILYNKVSLAKRLDRYYKYGVYAKDLDYLRSNYSNLEYRTYLNQFTGLDNQMFLSSLKRPFTLSYSVIDEFYHCGFRYYISNILKIREENTDQFYMNIGNIFHYVLSKAFINSDEFNFDDAWNEEASKYEFTFSKQILLERLKQELKYDIEVIRIQNSHSKFNRYLYEKRFVLPVENTKNIPVELVGIVDKICYLEEEKTLVSVIDYKTGHLPSDLNNIIYGIGMQLPMYLYFIKRSGLFSNLEIVGFYLQKIINKDMKKVNGKGIDDLKRNALKLVGYSTDKEDYLEKFDDTYQDSEVISSLRKKKDGFYAYSKILSSEEMAEIDNIVDGKIKDAAKEILDGNFKINPKKIGKDKVGCEFCSYRDICFRTEKDYIELPKQTKLSFLGGE